MKKLVYLSQCDERKEKMTEPRPYAPKPNYNVVENLMQPLGNELYKQRQMKEQLTLDRSVSVPPSLSRPMPQTTRVVKKRRLNLNDVVQTHSSRDGSNT